MNHLIFVLSLCSLTFASAAVPDIASLSNRNFVNFGTPVVEDQAERIKKAVTTAIQKGAFSCQTILPGQVIQTHYFASGPVKVYMRDDVSPLLTLDYESGTSHYVLRVHTNDEKNEIIAYALESYTTSEKMAGDFSNPRFVEEFNMQAQEMCKRK